MQNCKSNDRKDAAPVRPASSVIGVPVDLSVCLLVTIACMRAGVHRAVLKDSECSRSFAFAGVRSF
jgi:hypothetical protein